MPEYVFRGNGNREITFSAGSDMAAWALAIEHHSVSRDGPVRGETLFRVDRVPIERPAKATIERQTKLIAAANNIATR